MRTLDGRVATWLRAAVGAACAGAVGVAVAQEASEYTVRPPSVYVRDNFGPTRVEIYGRISLGWSKLDDPLRGRASGIESGDRSRIGLRAIEILDRDWRAHVQLEQSLYPGTGARADAIRPIDARFTAGLSHRDVGRLDLGRMEQAAALLLLRADPWAGATTLGPGSRLHAPVTPTSIAEAAVPQATLRSSNVASYQSPTDQPVRLVVQFHQPADERQEPPARGFSLAWDRLPWLLGIGVHATRGGARYIPVVAAADDGVQRLSLAWTDGREKIGEPPALVGWRNLFIGYTLRTMAKGDPQRLEWRAGLNLHRIEGDADGRLGSDSKIGAGLRYRLSRHIWTDLGAAWIRPRQGDSRRSLEATLTYSFQRDLQVPQGPRW